MAPHKAMRDAPLLDIPKRRQFPTRADVVLALEEVVAEFGQVYDSLPILDREPEWALRRENYGQTLFHVALPQSWLVHRAMVQAAKCSLISGMFERGKSIKRLARVERASWWMLWAETD